MLILQPVQQALPGVSPVRAAVAVETVTAVQGAEPGDRARNDGTGDRTAEAERMAREAKDRAADPDAPVGPPPAFKANVLEAERARHRKAVPVEPAQAGAAQEAKRGMAPVPGEHRTSAHGGAWQDGAAKARSGDGAEIARDHDDRAGARAAPAPTHSAYGGVRENLPRTLDVSR